MKISNASASKFYKAQIVEFILAAMLNVCLLVVMFTTYEGFSLGFFLSLCALVIVLALINFLVFKFLIKTNYYKRPCDNNIKYINLDKNNLQITYKNEEQRTYGVDRIEEIRLEIETEYYGKYLTVRPKKIIVKFLMKDSEKYSVEVRKLYKESYLKFIRKIIDNIPSHTKFSYKFSGLSYSSYHEELTNKIEKYKNKLDSK